MVRLKLQGEAECPALQLDRTRTQRAPPLWRSGYRASGLVHGPEQPSASTRSTESQFATIVEVLLKAPISVVTEASPTRLCHANARRCGHADSPTRRPADRPKKEAARAARELMTQGADPKVLTGDTELVT